MQGQIAAEEAITEAKMELADFAYNHIDTLRRALQADGESEVAEALDGLVKEVDNAATAYEQRGEVRD